MILDTIKFSQNIERVYIHVVQPVHLTHTLHATTRHPSSSSSSSASSSSFAFNGVVNMDKAVKIIYFDTYIDAAIDAYLHRLILLSGLRYTNYSL